MPEAPLYCTQKFHSELKVPLLKQRLRAYPQYTEKIAGMPVDELIETLQETPEANSLMRH